MDQLEQRLGTLLREAEVPAMLTDVDRAMVDGRRTVRRRRLLAAGIVAGLTAMALVAVPAAWAVLMERERPGIAAGQDPTVDFPATVSRPVAKPPALPASGPVGEALLTYSWADSVPAVVTADGDHYRLPGAGSISPDGRWLASPTKDDTYAVRDLTGARTWSLGSDLTPFLWSPDSDMLILADSDEFTDRNAYPTRFTRLDLRTGHVSSIDLEDPGSMIPVAVLASGDLLYGVGVGDAALREWPRILSVYRIELGGDAHEPTWTDLSGSLQPRERVRTPAGPQIMLAPDGRTAVLEIWGPDRRGTTPEALLVLDWAAEEVHRRIDYPRSSSPARWRMVGFSGGIVLETRTPVSEGDSAETEVMALDSTTGERRTVSRLVGFDADTLLFRGQGQPWRSA